MKTYKWFVVTVLVLALTLPATPVSAARSASIRLTPPTPNPGLIGSDVIFELVIDATDIIPGVAGAEIYLAYDPARVEPPASPLGVALALPDFFGVSDITIKEILPAIQCPGGVLPCIHLVLAGPPQTTHSGAAARFFFRGKAEGLACFTVLASTLVDADGFIVDHGTASPQCVDIVFRASVNGTVLRQGVPASPNLGGGTLACSVARIEPVIAGPVLTDASGNFTLPNLPSGIYTLLAEYPGYLASGKTITVSSGGPLTINAGPTTVRGGDVNGDKSINILDIGKIISLFGSTGVSVRSDAPDCTDPDEAADINDDGNVNISDLAITAGNWGRTGPTIWP